MLLLTNIRLILAVANTNGQRCEEGWDDKVDDGMDCLYFDTTSVQYVGAKQFCESKEAHLIELSSEEQLTKINKILNELPSRKWWWWGGATKQGGQWKWTTSGELLQQWIWGKWGSQPDENYPNSRNICFGFVKTAWDNGNWKGADLPCERVRPTICHKNPEIPTTTTTTTTTPTTTTSTPTTSATTAGIQSISDLIMTQP